MSNNNILSRDMELIGDSLLSLSKIVRNFKSTHFTALGKNEMLSTITDVDNNILSARRKLLDISTVMDTNNVE